MDVKELVSQFESLGDDCEFGVVQRYAGIEPLGFFRWSWTPLPALLEVLDSEFSNVDPERIELRVGLNSEYMVRVLPWGFQYHTHQTEGSIELDRLREQQVKTVGFLKRKLLDDLREGAKIFIRKGSDSRELGRAVELHRRLERFGPNTLLWVVPENGCRHAGTVEVLQPGLLKGHIDRLAPDEDAYDASPVWLEICRQALGLHRAGCPPGTVVSRPRGWFTNLLRNIHVEGDVGWWSVPTIETRMLVDGTPVEPRVPVKEHRLLTATGPAGSPVCGYTIRNGLAEGTVYTGSCHVWIAPEAAVQRVGTVLHDVPPLGNADADLAIRGAWQRVWVSGSIAAGQESATLGLLLSGEANAIVLTTCWQLETGPAPTAYIPSWSGRLPSSARIQAIPTQTPGISSVNSKHISCAKTEAEGGKRSTSMDLRALFQRFEGLGNNCEFGIVQKAVGYDAPSLFKNCGFNSTGQIIKAIDADFEGMFDDGTYSFERRDQWPDYALECHRYGIRFHTGLPSGHPKAQEEFGKRLASFRYMKEKLLSDFKEAEKIFVYRHNREFSDDLADRLLASIRRHGPATLLFVREDKRPDRRFAWVEPADRKGLLYGGIPRLSNENPPEINFAAWEKIGRGALRLVDSAVNGGRPAANGAGPSIGPDASVEPKGDHPEPPRGVHGVIEHRVFDRGPFFSIAINAAPLETYTVSVWLWISSIFSGSSINLVLLGFPTERFIGCDLGRRDCWQRISVTARVPSGRGQMAPAINASPDSHGVLYTAGWRVQQELDTPTTTPVGGAPATIRGRTATQTLGYRFNNGGLNNQKLALLGLFVEAKRRGVDIQALPDLCLFDQGEDMARKRGASVPFRHAPLSTYYETTPLQEFADRQGIRIRQAPLEDADARGWEFFGQGGAAIAQAQATGELSVDSFVCEFFRHLVSSACRSEELGYILESMNSRGIRAAVQCRVEKDWEHHTATNLNVVAHGEDHNPGFIGIIRKVKNTLAEDSIRGGVFVACDEAWLPGPKDHLREQAERELGITLFWKSDFLTAQSMSLPSLFLAMLDFEVSVRSELFVGLSRSTFSNLVSIERFARTRTPVTTSYIYNLPGPQLARRTDNGAYHWAGGAAQPSNA